MDSREVPERLDTTEDVNAEIIALMRRGDTIGVRTRLKQERLRLDRALREALEGKHQQRPSEELIDELYDALVRELQRYISALLPLIEHRSDLLADEVE